MYVSMYVSTFIYISTHPCASMQLKRAARGLGTDERAVVNILCSRTKPQTARIDAVFRQRYQRSLREYIEREMGGNLRTFLSYTQMAEVGYRRRM
jgi:hypothetical protein